VKEAPSLSGDILMCVAILVSVVHMWQFKFLVPRLAVELQSHVPRDINLSRQLISRWVIIVCDIS